jgi:hypothetical protein
MPVWARLSLREPRIEYLRTLRFRLVTAAIQPGHTYTVLISVFIYFIIVSPELNYPLVKINHS